MMPRSECDRRRDQTARLPGRWRRLGSRRDRRPEHPADDIEVTDMSDNAIPQLSDGPDAPRDVTRLYRERVIARPATAVTAGRTWDDDQLLEAAHAGAAGRDLHPDLLAALCRRFVDLVQDEAARAEQLAAARGALDQLSRVSAENVHLRHQIAGTTPACVQVALEAELSAETMRFHADAVVVDVPLPQSGGGR